MTVTETSQPLTLEQHYSELPDVCYARVNPTPVANPRLLRLNHPLARELGLDPAALAGPEGVGVLAGNRVPPGASPVALAYAGHQFGNFVPSLGDGRAILLGDRRDRQGRRRDIQLKGAGRTPFSRMGDGRAGLGPVVREYIVSEAMAGLGIPTSRALAMVTTGEPVMRQRAEPGAILTRVAASHIRVGTFEYFHYRQDHETVKALADHVIARHYSELADAANPYQAMLEAVAERSADLIAQWLLVGFIHGVMNTDNMTLSGETIDYGPCAFMDRFHPQMVYSSIDQRGRYAYSEQPRIGQWNLARLAETLQPLLSDDSEQAVTNARTALERYASRFDQTYQDGLAAKAGLAERREGDMDLIGELLRTMAEQGADFTLTFRRLADLGSEKSDKDEPVRALFADPAGFDAWAQRWRERLASEPRSNEARTAAMRAVNPAFIPRNHRVQQVIDAAEAGDTAPLDELLAVVVTPFDDHPERSHLAQPPRPDEVVQQTFCGT